MQIAYTIRRARWAACWLRQPAAEFLRFIWETKMLHSNARYTKNIRAPKFAATPHTLGTFVSEIVHHLKGAQPQLNISGLMCKPQHFSAECGKS